MKEYNLTPHIDKGLIQFCSPIECLFPRFDLQLEDKILLVNYNTQDRLFTDYSWEIIKKELGEENFKIISDYNEYPIVPSNFYLDEIKKESNKYIIIDLVEEKENILKDQEWPLTYIPIVSGNKEDFSVRYDYFSDKFDQESWEKIKKINKKDFPLLIRLGKRITSPNN